MGGSEEDCANRGAELVTNADALAAIAAKHSLLNDALLNDALPNNELLNNATNDVLRMR